MTRAAAFRFFDGTRFPLSFRQLLLIAFLGIILLLGGALTRTLLAVETLTEANRDYPLQALETVQAVRELQELTVALERETRQYLVLNDPAQLTEIRQTWSNGRRVAAALGQRFPADLPALTDAWQGEASQTLAPLLAGTDARGLSQPALSETFRQLGTLNQQIENTSKVLLAQRNQALIADFERQRRSVIWIGAAAASVAAVLALVLGMWLARAFKQLDRAIDALGMPGPQNPIAITGPSDMRELGQRLEGLRQRLAALEADKLLFLRHISHELKTPLANVREAVALLEDQVAGHLNPSQHEILGILRDNAIALQQQIESLLQYNAVAFDARRLQLRPVDLRALLEALVNRQRLQFQARQIDVTVEGPALTARI
ncbi:MAG: two-component sensor histidine kinase, partial [Betaproteobacteria bacterium]|nr:two-component sensor histidine kinase [Betaproteobacteria bacterium]